MEKHIQVPFQAEELAGLRAGDTVMLSGVIYTSRDKAHKRMVETLDKGESLPVDLQAQPRQNLVKRLGRLDQQRPAAWMPLHHV